MLEDVEEGEELQGARNWLEQNIDYVNAWLEGTGLPSAAEPISGVRDERVAPVGRHRSLVGPVGLEPTTSCSQTRAQAAPRPVPTPRYSLGRSVPHGCCRMGRRPLGRPSVALLSCRRASSSIGRAAAQPVGSGFESGGHHSLSNLAGVAELEGAPGLGPGGRESWRFESSPAPGHRRGSRALPTLGPDGKTGSSPRCSSPQMCDPDFEHRVVAEPGVSSALRRCTFDAALGGDVVAVGTSATVRNRAAVGDAVELRSSLSMLSSKVAWGPEPGGVHPGARQRLDFEPGVVGE